MKLTLSETHQKPFESPQLSLSFQINPHLNMPHKVLPTPPFLASQYRLAIALHSQQHKIKHPPTQLQGPSYQTLGKEP
ncbi:hypothetical protein ERO13_D05G321200v2 [Gossypium hirsutum]|uniref:Uncharacterized protein n=1 Tax=Gossypium mustelinum TaxID=34275 RepID=A0A5D2V4T2_GOSMU|nr:hypothetical protein ERO13_D05G321200v2 [Gossypium hirsutum]KAG4149078.1 hypothetical protein ERO13_D05G321200v2 [Gossypium hirsutum]KAG4149079.1 hypothetical protein ERO13_D05G321200v2 [Gossypium hirsutum]TYI84248.1 hypothetical protein E1A91_D05G351400v1 [Gossypium mustelinum]